MAVIVCWTDLGKGETYVEEQPFDTYEMIHVTSTSVTTDGEGDTTVNIRYYEYHGDDYHPWTEEGALR